MQTRRWSVKSVLLAASLVALPVGATESASMPEKPHCVLGSFRVTQVASLYTIAHAGQGNVERFSGAQLFLPAQPGLTPEWIKANLLEHKENKMKEAECPLTVPGATFDVVSGGTGFWIQVMANDPKAAKEILQRSTRLVQ